MEFTPNQMVAFLEGRLKIAVDGELQMSIPEKSKSAAGHGGNMTFVMPNGRQKVFAKKQKATNPEYRNYQVIDHLAKRPVGDGEVNYNAKLREFMPQVHGTMDWGGKKYMVMEAMNLDTPLKDVDIKPGNPVDRQEMLMAWGGKKFPGVASKMEFGAWLSRETGFTVTTSARGLRYTSGSGKALLKELESKEVKPDQLLHIYQRLLELKEAVMNADVALIGGSIVFEFVGGQYEPRLIDPAHMVIKQGVGIATSSLERTKRKDGTGEHDTVYFGTQGRFREQRDSNNQGINGLLGVFDKRFKAMNYEVKQNRTGNGFELKRLT